MEQTYSPEVTVSSIRDGLTFPMLAVVGAALTIIGVLVTWATVGPRSESVQLDRSVVRGLDLPDGWIVIIFAVALVVAVATLIVVASPRLRGRLVVGMLAASVVIAGIGVIEATAGRGRLEAAGLDRTAARISDASGLPFEALRLRLDAQLGGAVDEAAGAGLMLVIVGGMLGVTGSLGAARAVRGDASSQPPR